MTGGIRNHKHRKKQRDPHIGGQQLPLITPDSDWEAPTSLPDLRRCGRIALDIENKDDGLAAERGSSWPWVGGHISGVAIAAPGQSYYFPVEHPETTGQFDKDQIARWIADHDKAGVKFVTHHGSHDWGWLGSAWGVSIPKNLDDTEAMAAMVDENRISYRLDDLCGWRGIAGKDERKLREAAVAYGFSPKADLWRMPARYVGPYAAQDAAATLALADSLDEDITKEGLEAAYRLEMDIMPMVIAMRRRGIRVDTDAAEQAMVKMYAERDRALDALGNHLGSGVSIDDIRKNANLVYWFDKEKIPFGYTEKGAPSFQAKWMLKHPHWLPSLVARAEQMEEAATKFLKGFILDYAINGRLHGHINQFRGEEGGTRSYRFSYSDPPLQQMPARDEILAELIRGVFLPEDPTQLWLAADYSQQEYRLIVHYAHLCGCRGAEAAIQLYLENPQQDFHAMVAEWTGLDRKKAKDANFAKAYGAGVPKFASMINQSEEEAARIYEQYDKKLPFPKELSRQCSTLAKKRGWIKLLDGARSHFDMWEPAKWLDGEDWAAARPLGPAREKWGNTRLLRRAFTHKAMNRLIQGSSARMTKLAMRACYREGLLPLIQMHDELGFSVSNRKEVALVAEIMRECVKVSLPMRVDAEVGRNWGDAKHDPANDNIWRLMAA